MIDYGKLKLEQFRAASDRQLRLIEAYSKATEAAQPEIWKRKLHVIRLFATDNDSRAWVKDELQYIDDFSALDALYRESLKTASQLVDPLTRADPDRMKARRRFEQLYWADLPFAGEPPSVAVAMVEFREGLLKAESKTPDSPEWKEASKLLLKLSETLSKASHDLNATQARANR